MDIYGFLVWTTLSRGWAFIAATFIILVPLIQEIHAIWRQHNNNLKEEMKNNQDTTNINVNEGNGDLHSSTKAGGSKRGDFLMSHNFRISLSSQIREYTEKFSSSKNTHLNKLNETRLTRLSVPSAS